MKPFLYLLALLIAFANPLQSQSQSLKSFERKARKTFRKEAYGMSLYYSTAILKIDNQNLNAHYWAKQSAEKLNLINAPNDLTSWLPEKKADKTTVPNKLSEKENKPDALDSALTAPITLIVQTFNAMDSSALNGTYIGLTNDGYGEGKFIQNEEYENTAVFKIPIGEFFTATGTKNNFSSGSATISTSDRPLRDTIYRRLYLSPSWGLPLALYFDHNKPGANQTTDSTTNLTYEQTWIDYLYRIDDYIEGNTTDSTATAKAKAQYETGLFFANHIDANFHRLESFCGLLEKYLMAEKKITLNIEGYAGPHEQGENKNTLIKRRINSVENYFSFYKNGLFKQFQSNGQLKINSVYNSSILIDKIIKEIYENKNAEYSIENAERRKAVISLSESH